MADREAGRKIYHHGDLRSALIAAAERLMTERAGWTFTLREVARAAGVSHNAPYNHFPERRALLAAVAARGFEDFRAALQAAVAAAPAGDAATRLAAVARAYVAFATGSGTRFRLMFGPELAGCKDAPLTQAQERAFAVLGGLIEQGVADGTFREDPLGTHALAAWSLVHGLAILILDVKVRAEATPSALADTVGASLMTGLVRPER